MGLIEGALKRGDLRVAQEAQIFVVESQADMVAAITAAVAGNGDVILLPRGGIETTAQITQNKSGLRFIAVDDGMSPLARGEFNALYAAATLTDSPVMKVTAPTSFWGMGFASRDTGATFYDGAALLLGGDADANPWGVHVQSCRFPKWGLDNRIGIAIEGSSNCLIEDCDFEGVGSAFDSGIYLHLCSGVWCLRWRRSTLHDRRERVRGRETALVPRYRNWPDLWQLPGDGYGHGFLQRYRSDLAGLRAELQRQPLQRVDHAAGSWCNG
jgi:hypothetical protein